MIDAGIPEQFEDVTVWFELCVMIIAIIGGLAAFTRWMGRRMDHRMTEIALQLDERTKQIQPFANGGNSLTDVSGKVNLVMERQVEIGHELSSLRASNDLTHDKLGMKVDQVAKRLDEHSASPEHDRRAKPRES